MGTALMQLSRLDICAVENAAGVTSVTYSTMNKQRCPCMMSFELRATTPQQKLLQLC